MSERNACVFCIHEAGHLPNGDSGPWCTKFGEPIMGYSRGSSDTYAGMSVYSHSGQARDHQTHCSGFSLDPKMQERWNSYGFNHTSQNRNPETSAQKEQLHHHLYPLSVTISQYMIIFMIFAGLAIIAIAFDKVKDFGDAAHAFAAFSIPSYLISVLFAFLYSFILVDEPLNQRRLLALRASGKTLIVGIFIFGTPVILNGLITGDWPT